MRFLPRCVLAAALCGVAAVAPRAQQDTLPTVRLVPAPRLVMPGQVDSNVPMTWDLVDGSWTLFALTSFGGIPARLSGPALDQMRQAGPLAIVPHPGHGVWIESIIPDDSGTWYGYYHHESPAEACGRPDRFVPRIGALRSTDRGSTWEHLGIILEAAPDTNACASANRYVLGGVGDVSAVLAPNRADLYLFFSQYSKIPSDQGVAVARLVWADRDAPTGRVTIWRDGVWAPPRPATGSSESETVGWVYVSGTPLAPPSRPWHDGVDAADVFWGPSVHWNEYLERYVMLINRARNEIFNTEGIYVSYATALHDPRAWTAPRKIMNEGGWYPQVAGLEPMTGSDRQAGRRARFLMTGRSDYYIEFQR